MYSCCCCCCDIAVSVTSFILCCFRMVNALKMGEHMKKRAKTLSGGTKRKVSKNWFSLHKPTLVQYTLWLYVMPGQPLLLPLHALWLTAIYCPIIYTTIKNIRVMLSSQWGWRYIHINDTVGNVIYPGKWVSPIYTMYKQTQCLFAKVATEWRHNGCVFLFQTRLI